MSGGSEDRELGREVEKWIGELKRSVVKLSTFGRNVGQLRIKKWR